jgi:hypothetical protein
VIADWMPLHAMRSQDLIQEAEAAHRRRALPPVRRGWQGQASPDGQRP